MREMLKNTRDIARELARKYSTMTHDELDVLESILIPMKFSKGYLERVKCVETYTILIKDLSDNSILRMVKRLQSILLLRET